MPDYRKNILIISDGSDTGTDTILSLQKALRTEKSELDFTNIMPISPENNRKSWLMENWGTTSTEAWVDECEVEKDGDLVYKFRTLGGPCILLIEKISAIYANLTFSYFYTDRLTRTRRNVNFIVGKSTSVHMAQHSSKN